MLSKASDEDKSRASANSVVKENQKEYFLSQREIFGDKPKAQRLDTSSDRKEDKRREGKKSSTKLRKSTCLQEGNQDKVCLKSGTTESKEVLSQGYQHRLPNPKSGVQLQRPFKPKKADCLEIETTNVTEHDNLHLLQSCSEVSLAQILTKPFQNVELCRHEINGTFEDRNLESGLETDSKFVEIMSQFPGDFSSALKPQGMIPPLK